MRSSSHGSQSSKRGRFSAASATSKAKRKTGRFNAVPIGAVITIPNNRKYGLSPLPPKLRNTLVYSDNFTMNLVTGIGTYQFRANSMYDPDVTAAGHQPLYFDQLAALYNHWTVEKSVIQVSIGGLVNKEYQMVLYVDDDTSISAGANAAERPGAAVQLFNPQVAKCPIMKAFYDAAQTFGPSYLDDESLQGSSGANPTEQTYYTLVANDVAAASGSLYLTVKIWYTVVWDELTTVTGS